MKKSFLQGRTWLLIQIVVVIFLFAAMWWLKGDEFRRAFEEFELKWLAAAFGVYFVSLLLTFLRWQILVRALGLPFTMLDAFRLGFLGAASSLFLPGAVTGDLVKASFLATEQKRRAAAIATIVVDRVIGLYALVVLTSIIGAVYWNEVKALPQLQVVVYFVWAVTFGAALTVLSMFVFRADPFVAKVEKIRFVGRPIAELARALQTYKRQPHVIASMVVLGLVSHVGFVMTYQFCTRAVTETPPSWELQYLIIPIYMVGSAVPLTPLGNLGAGEWMLGGLFEMIGAPLEMGMAVAIAGRVVTWTGAAVGLIWYVPLHQELKRRQAQEASELIAEFEQPAPQAPPAEPTAEGVKT